MSYLKEAGMALLGGWIIGVVFGWFKLPAPVPPLMGLIGAAGVLMGGYFYSLLIQLFTK
jgi:XapX domain-containing protein